MAAEASAAAVCAVSVHGTGTALGELHCAKLSALYYLDPEHQHLQYKGSAYPMLASCVLLHRSIDVNDAIACHCLK